MSNPYAGEPMYSKHVCELMRDLSELSARARVCSAGSHVLLDVTATSNYVYFLVDCSSSTGGGCQMICRVDESIESSTSIVAWQTTTGTYTSDETIHAIDWGTDDRVFWNGYIDVKVFNSTGNLIDTHSGNAGIDLVATMDAYYVLGAESVYKYQHDGTYICDWTIYGTSAFDNPRSISIDINANNEIVTHTENAPLVMTYHLYTKSDSTGGNASFGYGYAIRGHSAVCDADYIYDYTWIDSSNSTESVTPGFYLGRTPLSSLQSTTAILMWSNILGPPGGGDTELSGTTGGLPFIPANIHIDLHNDYLFIADFVETVLFRPGNARILQWETDGTYINQWPIGICPCGDSGEWLTGTTWYAYEIGVPKKNMGPWPADNALDQSHYKASVVPEHIVDMRAVVERLATTGYYVVANTTHEYNWTDGDTDNLYYNAVDRTDYGMVNAHGYDWQRNETTDLRGTPTYDIDIGEVYECVQELFSADTICSLST